MKRILGYVLIITVSVIIMIIGKNQRLSESEVSYLSLFLMYFLLPAASFISAYIGTDGSTYHICFFSGIAFGLGALTMLVSVGWMWLTLFLVPVFAVLGGIIGRQMAINRGSDVYKDGIESVNSNDQVLDSFIDIIKVFIIYIVLLIIILLIPVTPIYTPSDALGYGVLFLFLIIPVASYLCFLKIGSMNNHKKGLFIPFAVIFNIIVSSLSGIGSISILYVSLAIIPIIMGFCLGHFFCRV